MTTIAAGYLPSNTDLAFTGRNCQIGCVIGGMGAVNSNQRRSTFCDPPGDVLPSATSGSKSSSEELLLTVIVPVFNEERTVDELLQRVVAAPYEKQVIVVNDCSTDATAELLEMWAGRHGVEVFTHSANRGKGAAIRTALEHAQGRFTIVQDADLEYDPEDYPLVIEPLRTGQAEVVYGSRYLARHPGQPKPPRLFRYGVSLLNVCVQLLYGTRLTDEATCYKAFPTAVLQGLDLQCERFEYCPEVTAKVCRMGLTIVEVPISYRPRTARDGKKIRFRDGLEALAVLWKWRAWRAPSATNFAKRGER